MKIILNLLNSIYTMKIFNGDYTMGEYIYLLEYYEEIQKDGFIHEKYSLIGVFLTEEDAEAKKYAIIKEWKLNENTVEVSEVLIGKSQWEGGFISV